MSEHIDHIISGIAVLLSLLGFGLGLRKHDSKRKEAELAARTELGRKYAALAVSHAEQVRAELRLQAALDAFVLADTALDGRRDFTDAQARVFIEAEVANRKKGTT